MQTMMLYSIKFFPQQQIRNGNARLCICSRMLSEFRELVQSSVPTVITSTTASEFFINSNDPKLAIKDEITAESLVIGNNLEYILRCRLQVLKRDSKKIILDIIWRSHRVRQILLVYHYLNHDLYLKTKCYAMPSDSVTSIKEHFPWPVQNFFRLQIQFETAKRFLRFEMRKHLEKGLK